MSVLSFQEPAHSREHVFHRLKQAQLQAVRTPVVRHRLHAAADVCRDTRTRLERLGVFFTVDPEYVFQMTCGNVRVTTMSRIHAGDMHLARFAQTFALYNGYTKPVDIRFALKSQPKVLSHRRPLTVNDINSGVSYSGEGIIILWRFDHDFWKVFIHEMNHLMGRLNNEAVAEACALDLWCMYRAHTYKQYLTLRQSQVKVSQGVAIAMHTSDPGTTNAVDYFVNAEALLKGKTPHGCSSCHADGSRDEKLVLTK